MIRMSVEVWSNDIEREKPEYADGKLSQYRFVHHIHHMEKRGIEPGPLTNSLSYGKTENFS